jgi:O-antigen/teichoic acid export membrane protein
MNHMNERDLNLHVTILGWLHIVGSGILLLVGAFLLAFLPGIGAVSGDPEAVTVLGIIGPVLCFVLTGIAAPGLLAGYGLLKRRSWARVLTIVVSILNLFNFPLGTAIGVYALWVLFQESATDYFMPLKPA